MSKDEMGQCGFRTIRPGKSLRHAHGCSKSFHLQRSLRTKSTTKHERRECRKMRWASAGFVQFALVNRCDMPTVVPSLSTCNDLFGQNPPPNTSAGNVDNPIKLGVLV